MYLGEFHGAIGEKKMGLKRLFQVGLPLIYQYLSPDQKIGRQKMRTYFKRKKQVSTIIVLCL